MCAGSIGEAFLLLEDDPARLARGLALVVEQLDRFVRRAFESDGGCLEGIGYWNYGLSHLVIFGEMLRARTGGAVDLLAQEKMKAIAGYPLAALVGPNLYASFSDAHEESSVKPYLAACLAERTGVTGLRGLIREEMDWRVGNVMCNLLWWDGKVDAPPVCDDVFLPVSGLARMVGSVGGKPLVVMAKAGNNAEPHNHNDVGSFIVCIDDTVYLCDPGPGLYSKDYFSEKRYENVFANSYGHSVPRIGGGLQEKGKTHRGSMEQAGEKSVRIAFQEAYAQPALTEAVRTLSVQQDQVVLEDAFSFAGAGLEVEEAFVTWQRVETAGSVARIVTDKGVLEIQANGGTFAAERLEEACKANHKSGVLTRISIVYPASPRMEARFSMRGRSPK